MLDRALRIHLWGYNLAVKMMITVEVYRLIRFLMALAKSLQKLIAYKLKSLTQLLILLPKVFFSSFFDL